MTRLIDADALVVLLIKDYEPATTEPKEVTMEELSLLLGYEVKIKK